MLPDPVVEPLQAHLLRVKRLYNQDLMDGCGDVELPDALARPRSHEISAGALEFIAIQAYRRISAIRGAVVRAFAPRSELVPRSCGRNSLSRFHVLSALKSND